MLVKLGVPVFISSNSPRAQRVATENDQIGRSSRAEQRVRLRNHSVYRCKAERVRAVRARRIDDGGTTHATVGEG